MVIYINNLWVLETETEGLNVKSNKKFVVYSPTNKKVLFSDDDINKCVVFSETFKNKVLKARGF
jgi:hypothetical protein